MGWYVVQLWFQLLLAFLVGLLTGWVLWRWGWKKRVLTQEHEVTRLRQAAASRNQLVQQCEDCAKELAALRAEHEALRGERAAAGGATAAGFAAVGEAEAPDDLKRIEGIGPKMEQALNAAGIRTFARLAVTNQATLRGAIEQAGMSFAPSLVTWAEQAGLLARGEEDAFRALTERLVAGRAPEQG